MVSKDLRVFLLDKMSTLTHTIEFVMAIDIDFFSVMSNVSDYFGYFNILVALKLVISMGLPRSCVDNRNTLIIFQESYYTT